MVLQLERTDAVLAAKLLEAAFEGRGGVTVTADGRANSVIVRGGEKELMEARRLIEVLDEGEPSPRPK